MAKCLDTFFVSNASIWEFTPRRSSQLLDGIDQRRGEEGRGEEGIEGKGRGREGKEEEGREGEGKGGKGRGGKGRKEKGKGITNMLLRGMLFIRMQFNVKLPIFITTKLKKVQGNEVFSFN